ncbi:MAG: BON domain-containing protein, partial [Methyloprofundus sp.]|nr:BON domain-containing protein [Methyloprofundus sp.]
MGLFDFAKDIGSKIFSNDADAAAKITEYISANNPGIEDLSVIFKDGQATIIGVTDNAEAAQKAILLAGNVEGVTEVIPKIQIDDIETDIGAALEPGNVEYYVIQSGDS